MKAEEQIATLKAHLRAMIELPLGTPGETWRKRTRRALDSVPEQIEPELGRSKLIYPDAVIIRDAVEEVVSESDRLKRKVTHLQRTLIKLLAGGSAPLRPDTLEGVTQYVGEHGCRTYIAAEQRVCMAPETQVVNGRMYCDKHAEAAKPAQKVGPQC